MKKQVKLVGATGYGGLGMIELLLRHPEFAIATVIATQDTGKKISDVWQYLRGHCEKIIVAPDSDEAKNCDAEVVVFATPDGVGQKSAGAELARGRKVLDYSGDFRFNSPLLFAEYSRRLQKETTHLSPELLPRSVYGLSELSELHREKISRADLVGNPGCFAMSCLLGLAPAMKNNLITAENIICDCKSGISGAGKKAALAFHYPERYDNMNAYRLSGHQHVMEIEHELSLLAQQAIKVTFTPQVVPMCRGIMSCLYGKLNANITPENVLNAYREFYKNSPFVFVQNNNESASTADVRGSNRCLLTIACDERSGVFRVISHLDNLVKGQAGNAVQNLNIMFGFPETLGLDGVGSHP